MKGRCPHCGSHASFREPTTGELATSVLKGIGGLFVSSKIKKASSAVDAVTSGTWKSYFCTRCDKKVHTCGDCGNVEKYQDFGAVCSKCGYR